MGGSHCYSKALCVKKLDNERIIIAYMMEARSSIRDYHKNGDMFELQYAVKCVNNAITITVKEIKRKYCHD